MKTLLATLLIAGSTLALGACASDNGAGNAHGRTAGADTAPMQAESTFRRAQVK